MSAHDRALIRGCRKGDARSWEQLLDEYERLVFSIPLKYGLSREDAADVTQLVFTILLQSIETLSEDSRLGPWLSTVTRRHTWRLLQRNRRESTGAREDLSDNAVLVGKDTTDTVEHWELTEWLNHGLSLLGKRCRELLLALYFQPEQPSYAEISDSLGMPVGSIGPTRARCLKDLRDVLLKRGSA
ncbi:MAG: RNA polymerase sigma factor [Rubrobacteraceae bacterium]